MSIARRTHPKADLRRLKRGRLSLRLRRRGVRGGTEEEPCDQVEKAELVVVAEFDRQVGAPNGDGRIVRAGYRAQLRPILFGCHHYVGLGSAGCFDEATKVGRRVRVVIAPGATGDDPTGKVLDLAAKALRVADGAERQDAQGGEVGGAVIGRLGEIARRGTKPRVNMAGPVDRRGGMI